MTSHYEIKIAERRNCLCCGFPTLTRADTYWWCHLCGWENDGQDDPHADEEWGGPNDVSLTEGRRNFEKYRDMYAPGQGNQLVGDTEFDIRTKNLLVDAFRRHQQETNPSEMVKIEQEVWRLEKALADELHRKLEELAKQNKQ